MTQAGSDSTGASGSIQRIVVRIRVGEERMAASDDPLFLHLDGPLGREFRLDLAHGRSLRRGAQDEFVLGGADDPTTNVAHPELNDPGASGVTLEGVREVSLVKRSSPIPNVRGVGELDDRLQVEVAEVELHSSALPAPVRYCRQGPVWLGLICGQRLYLERVEPGA